MVDKEREIGMERVDKREMVDKEREVEMKRANK